MSARRWSRLGLLFAVALGCSSSVEPPSSVTVRVTNTTCTPGPCTAIRVLAFPSNHPNTPGGAWSLDLGVVTTAFACVVLPPTRSFYIIQEPGDDTTSTTTWTTDEAVSLGAQPPSSSLINLSLTATDAFVPRSAAGWSVDLPGGTRAVPAAPCTP